MTNTTWGLLGPEQLASERRTRTLHLGAAVRTFNDLAFPGLGGVWFGKQIFLATLGVIVAEEVRRSGKQASNIQVANAIEALACWLALDGNDWQNDPRLRGARKLRARNDLAFSKVRKRGFYVTAPMRQVTIQPLKEFGLVDSSGERFNSFRCNPIGNEFVDLACRDFKPYRRSVVNHLVHWVTGEEGKARSTKLRDALSPLLAMPEIACDFLRQRIVSGSDDDASRRQNSFAWADQIKANSNSPMNWDRKPRVLSEVHWSDLRAGAKFFLARDAAIGVLDQVELAIGNSSKQKLSLDAALPSSIKNACAELRLAANVFLQLEYDPTSDVSATKFCRECCGDSNVTVIENLLAREGRVLRQAGRNVIPGAAFRGVIFDSAKEARSDEEDGEETKSSIQSSFPEGISNRAKRMYLLNLDLGRVLDSHLYATQANGEGS